MAEAALYAATAPVPESSAANTAVTVKPSAEAEGPRTDGFCGHEEAVQGSPVQSGDSCGTSSSGHAVLDDDKEITGDYALVCTTGCAPLKLTHRVTGHMKRLAGGCYMKNCHAVFEAGPLRDALGKEGRGMKHCPLLAKVYSCPSPWSADVHFF